MNLILVAIPCLFAVAAAQTGLSIVDIARRMGLNSYLLALEETNNLDLVANTDNITVFIPTNEAFLNVSEDTRNFWRANPAYYQDLMRYHVVKGAWKKENFVDEDLLSTTWTHTWNTSRFVNYTGYSKDIQLYQGAVIRSFDNVASNGIFHVLDNVVTSPQNQTLMGIVQGRNDLSMIASAVTKVDNITNALNDITAVHPVTFLAPNDDAIKKLPTGKWASILSNETQLKEILQFHVLEQGTWFSRGLIDKLNLPTYNKNGNVTVAFRDNGVFFDKGRAVVQDLAGINGVVHVVDTLLLPPGMLGW